jgi:hypothetical protein
VYDKADKLFICPPLSREIWGISKLIVPSVAFASIEAFFSPAVYIL